jgi:hypothetical protein
VDSTASARFVGGYYSASGRSLPLPCAIRNCVIGWLRLEPYRFFERAFMAKKKKKKKKKPKKKKGPAPPTNLVVTPEQTG